VRIVGCGTDVGPVLRSLDGTAIPLLVDRWHAAPRPEELVVLENVEEPILDVGCGPGRHTLALAARGMVALGIDVVPTVVASAQQRGTPVLERSVFDRLPGEGRWATALLLDGNIGIGGDPVELLGRLRELLGPFGHVLVEVGAPGSSTDRCVVRVERDGRAGPWFRWARVSADGIATVATAAGLTVRSLDEGGGRWFARLGRA